MPRTPFNRWDIGTEPRDGVEHPFVAGRKFKGTIFAMLFDLQWEWFCTAKLTRAYEADPYERDMTFPVNACDFDYNKTDPHTIAKDREAIIRFSTSFADYLVKESKGDDERLKEMLDRQHFMEGCRLHFCQYHCPGILLVMKKMSACAPNALVLDPEMRANMLISGCIRHCGILPETVPEVPTYVCQAINHWASHTENPTENQVTENVIEAEIERFRLKKPLETAISVSLPDAVK